MLTLWTVAILLRPGYDQLTQYGSELATGQDSTIMNANFVITGSLIIIFFLGLFTHIHAGKWPAVGAMLLGIFGVGEVVTAAFPCDPGCPFASSQSPSQSIHNLIAVIAFGSLALAPLLISSGLKRDTLWGRVSIVFSGDRIRKHWTLPTVLVCRLVLLPVCRPSATCLPRDPLSLDRANGYPPVQDS